MVTFKNAFSGFYPTHKMIVNIIFPNQYMLIVKWYIFHTVSADRENIDAGLESLCISVTEHALSGQYLVLYYAITLIITCYNVICN